MDIPITYRFLRAEDVPEVCAMVNRVFDEFVAPEYSSEGIREFRRYTAPNAFGERAHSNHFSLLAWAETKLVGMIEVRSHDHVSLLFVDPGFHHRGIAKELMRRTVQICRTGETTPSEISVNSSSYAVPIYEKLGFRRAGEKQVRNGIGFIPMVLDLIK
jgi:GNAT superfamily N-acetyltransferase